MEKKGSVNTYTCNQGHVVVTVLTDDGTTPAVIPCPECGRTSFSGWYNPHLVNGRTPTHEWYKPTGVEYVNLRPALRDHVSRGGLLLRWLPPQAEKAA